MEDPSNQMTGPSPSAPKREGIEYQRAGDQSTRGACESFSLACDDAGVGRE